MHRYSFDEIRRVHVELIRAIRAIARRRGFSIKTEQTYEHWILRYVAYHDNADPHELEPYSVGDFLQYLALRRNVAAAAQNVALNALAFLFRDVLKRTDVDFGEFAKAKRPQRLPTVLDRAEVACVLSQLNGTRRLMVELMYGTGMRLMECCRLRVQDVDFAYAQITVRAGKGGKDRNVPLPEKLTDLAEL